MSVLKCAMKIKSIAEAVQCHHVDGMYLNFEMNIYRRTCMQQQTPLFTFLVAKTF